MYCLDKDNAELHVLESSQASPASDPSKNLPFIEFVDVDRDGMLDMYFYHEGKIFVYYNQLPRKHYSSGLGESYLCFKEKEASTGAVFQDYDALTSEAIE